MIDLESKDELGRFTLGHKYKFKTKGRLQLTERQIQSLRTALEFIAYNGAYLNHKITKIRYDRSPYFLTIYASTNSPDGNIFTQDNYTIRIGNKGGIEASKHMFASKKDLKYRPRLSIYYERYRPIKVNDKEFKI